MHVILGIDVARADLHPDPLELIIRHAVFHEFRQSRIHRRFSLRQLHAIRRRDIEVEGRLIERGAVIARADIERLGVIIDQRLAQNRRRAISTKDLGQNGQGRCLFLITRVALRCEVAAGDIGARDARIGHAQAALGQLRRLCHALTRGNCIGRRQRAVIFLRKALDLGRCHIARDNKHRVIGRVIIVIPFERILTGEGFHLMPPADHRCAVRMVEILRGAALLGEKRCGVAIDPLVALLQDHLALGFPIVRRNHQIAHPVGFHLHHQLQQIRGDALVIGSIVIRGERVIGATIGGHRFRELPRSHLIRAFEHQVFEIMRDTGFPAHLIGGTCPIPDHLNDNRRAVIFDHHSLHPVIESEMSDLFGQCGGNTEPQSQRERRACVFHETYLKRLGRAPSAANLWHQRPLGKPPNGELITGREAPAAAGPQACARPARASVPARHAGQATSAHRRGSKH